MLEKASKLDPKNAEIYSELGWLYFHQNLFKRAQTSFNQALKLEKEHPQAMLGLGVSLLKTGENKEAVHTLKRLNQMRPYFAAVNFFLAQAQAKEGQLEESLENYLTTLRRDWTFAESRTYLAETYEKLGRTEQAWRQYSNILSLDPQNPSANASLKKLSQLVPEEIKAPVPLAKISFSEIQSMPMDPKIPKMRIGLWTSPAGAPSSLGSITFEADGPFSVVGTKTGKVYGTGQKGEEWKAKFHRHGLSDIQTPEGKGLGPFKYGVKIEHDEPGKTILIQEVFNPNGEAREYVQGREYRGSLIIVPATRSRGIYLINEVQMEEYLLGVLPGEMPCHWPLEALKAQAVIARTYGFLRLKSFRVHRQYGYDLCDSQHCQVYKGVSGYLLPIAEKENCQKAVGETRGKFLYYRGNRIQSFYHSHCGGHTQSSEEVSGWGNYAYLTGKADSLQERRAPAETPWEMNLWIKGEPQANCNLPEYVPNSAFRWLRIVPKEIVERKLNRRFRIGKIEALVPLKRSKSGHINELMVHGSKRTVILKKEHQIRNYLGMESLRSTLYLVEAHKDSSGKLLEFWIWGGGWGHGIGMCQAGAVGLAEREKKNYEEILRFYYEGADVR